MVHCSVSGRMHYGSRSLQLSPHDAVCSSRAPSVARSDPYPGHPLWLNPKNVAKWRRRRSIVDAPMGPSRPRSSVLTNAEEPSSSSSGGAPSCHSTTSWAAYARPSLGYPASLYTAACSGTASPPPKDEEKISKRRQFAETKIGYVHINVCELRPAQASCSCSRPSAVGSQLIRLLKGTGPAGPGGDHVSKFVHIAFWTPTRRPTAPCSSARSSPHSPTACTPCSLTTGWPLPTCPRTAAAIPRSRPSSAGISSTARATRRAAAVPLLPPGDRTAMAANIASRSPAIPFRRLLPALVGGSGSTACWPSMDEWSG